MKKIIALSAAAIAMAAVSAPAAAQSGPTVDHELRGEVESICGAFDFQDSPVLIDFGILSDVPVGQRTPEIVNGVTIVCNGLGGGTVNITSQNQGFMFLTGTSGGAAQQVGYVVRATGGSGLAFGETNLASPVARPFNGSSAFVNGQSMTLRFAADGVLDENAGAANQADRTTVFAGIYTDIVTVDVTAN
ncbi:MAG: hypothetical protein AAGH53_02875 [Pseudomonadota bacterium]